MQVARAITLEATLSFLGLGVPVTEPSLGLLISSGYEFMLSGTYWIALFPGIALLVTILRSTLSAIAYVKCSIQRLHRNDRHA